METIDIIEQKYVVKTQSFEGPLDLLLSLIENRKLFINEISLSSITEDYAGHVQKFKDEYKGEKYYEITGYLVVLATLLLIKSRSLLPNFEISTEEKVSIEDLEDRLKIYKVFKDFSKILHDKFFKNSIRFKHPQKKDVVFIPDHQITKELMAHLISEVIKRVPVLNKTPYIPEVKIKNTITLEDIMERIHLKVDEMTSFSFRNFTGSSKKEFTKEEKVFTVISFLAILELIRTGILSADQNDTFGDMYITKNNFKDE